MKYVIIMIAVLLTGCAGQSRLGGAMTTDRADEIALCQVAYYGESTEEKVMAYQELVYRGFDPKSNECERHAAQVTAFGDRVIRLVGEEGFQDKVKHIPANTVEPAEQYGEEIDLIDLLRKF